ncbi:MULTISPECIES: beta-class carbonic anhydrase [Bacillus]|uniref:carbonic anhydrase n=2 Tax=Bacillus TaxID=1386 RepID=A0A0M5JAS9_9BACI|nr:MULTISPECIES: carbonic anhydrase [Bacillus]ALC83519.1 carbonic anhydrase [Bacillus gobiensis]MBP1082500.1 carbonic anhydrase [Bacillus capparidis]MED1097266.1 carbonic anhydrase [Bacillus capparidis]
MSLLQEVLTYNQKFVDEKKYEKYCTTKFPDKRLVIVTCMDTRLVELLPRAMNFQNGDVKIIKSVGAIVDHPFGSIMRSILIAIYELQANEVCVVGHYDCGAGNLDADKIIETILQNRIDEKTLQTIKYSGIDLYDWLKGFNSVEDSVCHSVDVICKHPLLPKHIPVHGLVIHPVSGKLELLIDGTNETGDRLAANTERAFM